MTSKRRQFSAEFKARVVRAALRDYQNPTEARFGLGRYFAFYNTRRRHQSLGRKTPAVVYGLAKENDVAMLKTDGGRSAVTSALASVALRAPSPRAG